MRKDEQINNEMVNLSSNIEIITVNISDLSTIIKRQDSEWINEKTRLDPILWCL